MANILDCEITWRWLHASKVVLTLVHNSIVTMKRWKHMRAADSSTINRTSGSIKVCEFISFTHYSSNVRGNIMVPKMFRVQQDLLRANQSSLMDTCVLCGQSSWVQTKYIFIIYMSTCKLWPPVPGGHPP